MNLSLESRSEELVRVSVAGKVSLNGGPPSFEPLGELLGELAYAKSVLLDAGGVDLIDSTGLGWLVRCEKRFRAGGGKLIIHSLQPIVGNVLKIVRLDQFFTLAVNENHALYLIRHESNSCASTRL